MKKLFRCLMAMSFLTISSAGFSQPRYARQDQQGQQEDQMKKDEMKKREMKKDSPIQQPPALPGHSSSAVRLHFFP